MSEDNLKNWNEDKPWSEVDLFDLQNNVARGDLVEETAELLMRREDEVRQKINELRDKKKARHKGRALDIKARQA